MQVSWGAQNPQAPSEGSVQACNAGRSDVMWRVAMVGKSLGPQLCEVGSWLTFLTAEGNCRTSAASEGRFSSLEPFSPGSSSRHIRVVWARMSLPRRSPVSALGLLSPRPSEADGSAITVPLSLIRKSKYSSEVTLLRSPDIRGGSSETRTLAPELPARVPAFTPVSRGDCELCLRSPMPFNGTGAGGLGDPKPLWCLLSTQGPRGALPLVLAWKQMLPLDSPRGQWFRLRLLPPLR